MTIQASLSVCLRDSARALHLRHTTECVLQRVLCFSVSFDPQKRLRCILFYLKFSIHIIQELSTVFVNFAIASCGISAIFFHHTEKFPATPLIEAGMPCEQIGFPNTEGIQIFAGQVKQILGKALLAAVLLNVYGADIGSQVLALVKVIFNNA